jgi:hypothetical protein
VNWTPAASGYRSHHPIKNYQSLIWDQEISDNWARSGSPILAMLPILAMTSWDPKIDISPKSAENARFWFFAECPRNWTSVMKFHARNLPDGIFCRIYAEVSNLQHTVAPISSGPLVLPLMIELCHVVIDEVWLAFPQWRAISLTQRNASKSSDDFIRGLGITQQELWWFRKSSHDNRWLAMPSPSDLRYKKCHIYC